MSPTLRTVRPSPLVRPRRSLVVPIAALVLIAAALALGGVGTIQAGTRNPAATRDVRAAGSLAHGTAPAASSRLRRPVRPGVGTAPHLPVPARAGQRVRTATMTAPLPLPPRDATGGRPRPGAEEGAAYWATEPLVDAAGAPTTAWLAPVQPVLVLHGFAAPPEPWLPGHRGVDLAAPADAVVRAAGAGVVLFAGTVAGRGVVSLQHGDLRTTYEPVTATVRRGDAVGAGAEVGVVQDVPGHCAPASCLHWGLRRGPVYLDPMLLLVARQPPRLLPLP